MGLKRILIASYAGQIYVALIGIVMMPVYLRYLGAEAYGLIGFFAMLQAWLQLLDMGLTPTLSRETARFKAAALDGLELKRLLRTLEWFFGSLAVVTIVLGIVVGPWVAVDWLRLQALRADVAASAIGMMGAIAGLRWFAGLYRSGLVGMERQVAVNASSALFATLKFVGVVLVLQFVSNSITAFFQFQIAIAVFEALTFRALLYRTMPITAVGAAFSPSAIRRVLPFAGSLAFLAGLWVVIVNLDKLLLSHFMTLHDYGYFTLAIVVANGVTLLSTPLLQAISPRMTILVAQKKTAELINFYRTTTQFIAALMMAVSGVLALFAEPLLLAWTDDQVASAAAAPILFWYALGNGVVGILSLPYQLQYAYGYLRLHVIGNILFGVVLVPSIAFAAWKYGAIGAGITWFVENLAFLLLWVPSVHARLTPSIVWAWPLRDVLPAIVLGTLVVILEKKFIQMPEGRLAIILLLGFNFALALFSSGFAGGLLRVKIMSLVRRRVSSSPSPQG